MHNKELLFLELRNAICDKEWIVAYANMETTNGGGWSCDWGIGIGEADDRIQALLVKIENTRNTAGETMKPDVFEVGSRFRKVGGSYQANGTIVAAFKTRSGHQRYVFEFDNPAGMLHIFNHEQIKRIEGDG